MKISDLIFIGIKGSVLALNRATGDRLWSTHLKGSDFVNVVVQEHTLLASCQGEIFCLDALTGEGRWHNPLKGFGTGLATIAAQDIQTDSAPLLAAKRRNDESAAAASAVVASA